MSNSYFQFKQFTVHQEKCAMKVSTDACIQGAWTPLREDLQRILDIGAGTGLLSLMLAQRSANTYIDSIELDAAAAQQAQDNFIASPWADRLTVLQGDATGYPFTKQYDMVICNPPFFNNSLPGYDAGRNLARHITSLTYEALFETIKKVLQPLGYAVVLLPAAAHANWENMVKSNGWSFERLLQVIPKPGKEPNRIISSCVPYAATPVTEVLQIYNTDNSYTGSFKSLLQPFYLQL